ncbi:response regulator [soil metagenome]
MINQDIKTARILIVDDEDANVKLLMRNFKLWGFENLTGLTDSRRAIEAFKEIRPDLTLLDLRMPDIDGFQFLSEIGPLIAPEDFVPIIILTADMTSETKQSALSKGAKDFLTKPFDRTEILLRVTNLLETRLLHLTLQRHNETLEEQVHARTEDLERSQQEALECLALAAEYRDDDTGRHTARVGLSSYLIAEAMQMSGAEANLIRRAAPLHDVGKIGISDSILLKPGRLEPAEFEKMRTHAEIGSKILSAHHFPIFELAAQIAHTHHERWDGKGYPRGIAGGDIPIGGRIVTVADVFDALTHERVYKAAWKSEDAILEIERMAGTQFDPQIAAAFIELYKEGRIPI